MVFKNFICIRVTIRTGQEIQYPLYAGFVLPIETLKYSGKYPWHHFFLLPGLTKRYIKCVFPRIITYLKLKKEKKFAKFFRVSIRAMIIC